MRIAVALLALVLAAGPVDALTVLLYARADAAQAERAVQLLRSVDEVWHDRDLVPGEPWRLAVAERICTADRVLVLWSERAAASPEVAAEWRLALSCGRVLVPVRLDGAAMPAELAARQAVDWTPPGQLSR